MTPASTRGDTAPVSVAPMMDVTDRHTRWLYRRISRHTLLYTEMVTAHALHHGDVDHLLRYDASEHPVALQLGGDDPDLLAHCARLGVEHGYDEINLNVGCPSPRVQKGNFGACLMQTPDVVARAVHAMRAAVDVPVTVKCRIGVDDLDRYEDLLAFAHAMVEVGVDRLTVHARKAWLSGLSPKQNRNVPPLRYAEVHRLKVELPDLPIEINGGFTDLDAVAEQQEHVDAVMIGRGVWHDPWLLADVDRRFFGAAAAPPSRDDVVTDFVVYAEQAVAQGVKAQHVLRHAGPLFAGQVGVKAWKQCLAQAHKRGPIALLDGLAAVRQAQERHEERAARLGHGEVEATTPA